VRLLTPVRRSRSACGNLLDEMRAIILTSAALLVVTGCTSERVVNTGEWETFDSSTPAAAPPPLPPTNAALLANKTDFVAHPNGQTAYYFSTPSGRWQCAIVPRSKAGCQSTTGPVGIADAPETVPNDAGDPTAPNAIVVEPKGDAHFAAVGGPPPESVNVLPFNRTLIADRFRCNIQETTGVSCLSEESGKGFTFSADGFNLQYSEVPLDAP
jgi:hypothetical protein